MSAKTNSKNSTAVVILDEVYLIEGLGGQTLDILHKRADAIREFITYYKARKVEGARLYVVLNGIKWPVYPTGTAADYN